MKLNPYKESENIVIMSLHDVIPGSMVFVNEMRKRHVVRIVYEGPVLGNLSPAFYVRKFSHLAVVVINLSYDIWIWNSAINDQDVIIDVHQTR